ncbi:MAG: TonB-dependent receptor [Prolixibacteraceae bacterium]|nr:TonB-dependent receptor [Prolixibacteraceae bacterium]
MKKNQLIGSLARVGWTKLLRVMKLTAFLVLILVIDVSASLYSQNSKVSVKIKNGTLSEIFSKIEEHSEYRFFYQNEQIRDVEKKTIDVSNKNVLELVSDLLSKTGLTYKLIERNIIVFPKTELNNYSDNDFQQLRSISGKVTDSSGSQLPGVSVILKGTTTGVITDSNGNYLFLNVPADATLVFSFIGMERQEIQVAGKTDINVILLEEIVNIEEVVAVGYGTQKKREIVGSISTISSNRFSKASGSSNFADLIQGQAAGVSVQSTSGVPGSESNILIRGLSSINASVNPLWIIDGVPIITSSGLNNAGTTDQSPMSLINPNDIESIEVLKDAAATSIYGSRGSNGVILVTTKSGKSGNSSINVDYSTGISDLPIHKVKYLNTNEWFNIMDEAAKANGHGEFLMTDHYAKIPYSTLNLTREQAEKINTNWFNETMRRGEFQNLNLSVIGGNEKSNYYLSGNYRNDNSVMIGNGLKRYTLRSNVGLKPANNMEVGVKLSLALSKNNRVKNATDNETGNLSGTSGGFNFLNTKAIPWYPVYNPGSLIDYYNPQTGMNPAASIDPNNMIDVVDMYRFLGGVYAEYFIPKVNGLKVRSELSVDFLQSNMNFWASGVLRKNGSYASDQSFTQKTFNYNLYGTYIRSYELHSISVVGGVEAQRTSGWNRQMQGQDLIGTYQELGTPNQKLFMSSGMTGENYLLAYFGRANYNFKDKYLAGVSIRTDGSSTFTPEYRWGTFAAFSAGWIFSDESFMDWLGKDNLLKIRGSFGQTGNQNIPSRLNVTGYNGSNPYASDDIFSSNGTSVSTIGVTDLTWETTNNFDIGLDFGFLNNKINGSLAFYNKLVKGLLLQAPIPVSVGLSAGNTIWQNAGNLLNKGFEFNISSTNISTHNFNWKTNFNLTFNRNEVTKLLSTLDDNGKGMISGGTGEFITKVGHGINEFYLAEEAGIDPQTGIRMIYARDKDYFDNTGKTRRLKDAEGTDVKLMATADNINNNLFHIIGKSTLPSYFGGISNSFEYKGFDLNIQMIFSGGNYILDWVRRQNVQPNVSGVIDKDILGNYWTKPGDVAKYPRLDWYGNMTFPDGTSYGSFDSRTRMDTWAYKGDFLKIKTITLGYKVPKAMCNKLKLQSMRVFGSIDNLYTLTKYPGWDPEGLQLVNTYNLPQLLAGTVGLSIKF